MKILMIIFVLILIFFGLNIFLLNMKKLKKKVKKVISIFAVIVLILMTGANFYIGKTLGVLHNNGDSKYKLGNYSVIVLENSNYKELKDIANEKVGYFKNFAGSDVANKKLQSEVKITFKEYSTTDSLVNDLLNSKINVIVLEDSIKNIMIEEIENFEKDTKVIYTFTVQIKVETTLKEVNVAFEPFAIYISGIDTYGEISSVSRSDVNMVMVVNPEKHQILLISLPRDYYVQLHGTTGTKDKLTHAGIYGIDMSIQTIEDLLQLNINYYVKVNFTSVVDIVDALGGLDVYSEYTFTSYSGYSFKKGMNSVNGEQALDFARTRKAFKEGDRQRGKNQQALIKAMIDKATDKSIITKYNSLLDAVNGKYQTNMSVKTLTSLIKSQLNDITGWNIHTYSLTGRDATDYTYTYNQLLYVMKPNDKSVNEAIQLIDDILKGKKLENSYTNFDGTSNKVTKVPQPIEPQPIEPQPIEPQPIEPQPEQDTEIEELPEENQKDEIETEGSGEESDLNLPNQSDEDLDNNQETNDNESEKTTDETPDISEPMIPDTPDNSENIENIENSNSLELITP